MIRSYLIKMDQKITSLLHPANNIKEEVRTIQLTISEAYNPAFLTLKKPDGCPQKINRKF